MKKIVNSRPIVFASLLLLIGAFWGRFASVDLAYSIILPLSILASGFLLKLFLKKSLYILLALSLCLGVCASIIDVNVTFDGKVEGEKVISGRVCEEKSDNRYVIENLKINGEAKQGKALIYAYYPRSIGTEVMLLGNIYTNEVNYFDSYSMSYYCDKIYYKMYCEKELIANQGRLTFTEKTKKKITGSMEKYMNPEDYGIIKSLLFGDKSDLDKEDGEMINGIGLAHIFAVSGLHIGFLAGVVLFVLKKLRVNAVFSLIAVIGVLLFYGGITGFPAGVKRATIMIIVAMIGKIMARKNDSLTTLALSAGIIVLTNPRELFDIGFIMSFLAVLGIICFYKSFNKIACRITQNKVLRYFLQILATTLSANLFVLPVSYNVFNSVSLYSAIGNMAILPIVTIVFLVSAITAIACLVYSGFGAVFYCSGWGIKAIRSISTFIYSLPYAELSVENLGIITLLYILALLVLSPYILLKKNIKYSLSGVLGMAIIAVSFL